MSSIPSPTPIEYVRRLVITRELLRNYADASGDTNEIHLDERVALSRGLPGVIAHGMLISAHLHGRAERWLKDTNASHWVVKKSATRFKAMTLVGDEVWVGGSVKSSAEQELVLELCARNQRGETTATAIVTLVKSSP